MEKERQYSIDILAAMADRTIRKLWFIIVLLIILLFASNAAWIWYENQFTDEVWTFEATADGGNAIANGNGEVFYYGTSEGDTQEAHP